MRGGAARRIMRWLGCGVSGLGLLVSAPATAAAGPEAALGPGVVAALAKEGRVRVVAELSVASPAGRTIRRFRGTAERAALRATTDDVVRSLPRDSFQIERRFERLPGLALEVDAEGLLALLAHPAVIGIDLDPGGSGALVESKELARIPPVARMGLRGRKVTIFVVDTGVDRRHRDLRPRVEREECFCSTAGGCCPDGSSRQSGPGSADDDNGHGTHVTSIAAGRGRLAPRGVAPKLRIRAYKVMDENNSFCCFSDVLAALDHILGVVDDSPSPRRRYLVNMSLGTFSLFGGRCDRKAGALGRLAADVIGDLRDAGVAVFSSAGNEGAKNKMGLPSCIRDSIAVGAVYDDDFSFANWSVCSDQPAVMGEPTCFSNSSRETDLYAPGAEVTAAWPGGVRTISGTSMASPMTAGCAALLLELNRQWTVRELERALESSSRRVREPARNRTFPLLDCHAAARR